MFLLAYFAKIKLLLMMGGFRSWTKARLATKKEFLHSLPVGILLEIFGSFDENKARSFFVVLAICTKSFNCS